MFGTITKTIKIEGMHCNHCSGRAKAALEAVKGVKSAAVSHETGEAKVKVTKDVTDDALRAAVEGQGFTFVSVE